MTDKEFAFLMLPDIEAQLHRVVDNAFSDETQELHQMMSYHLGWTGPGAGPAAQGKRLRPLLLLLCTAVFNHPWQPSLPAAAAVELIHNFSLIHDDIQDNSPMRRGRPTVWTQWGIPQAINAGDAMFSLAQLALLDLHKTTSPETALRASLYLNQACLKLTEGQYLDLAYESRQQLSPDAYWPMIKGKTAALLSTCAVTGALLGDASPSELVAFEEFGRNLGLAFQIQDDFLGIWGDAELTGKSTQSDLVSGKKSFPVLFGLSLNGKFAQRWQAGPIQPEEAPAVAAIMSAEGVKEYTCQTADHLTQMALENLQSTGFKSNPAFETLLELVHQLLSRQS
jgi:geranylgeranyl diphosphate synthase type I